MDDAGNLHVLEAAFVAILLLTAMSFVLTFSLPSSPDDPVRKDLERSATTSLGTLYDIPLDDPAYGNSTMSKALAEALKGRPGNLTDQLNATLPPGTIYNVYLNNGYGLMPVYETRDPQGQAISVSRPLEPRWTYTFLSTDVGVYPNEASGSTAKMTTYGLPVVKGMPVREGGVDVDVVITGQRNVHAIGESAFEVGSSLAVVQSNATFDTDPLPHVSVTFRNASWDPTASVVHDDSGGTPSTETLQIRLEETANRSVAAGTDLTITVPRGWQATATNDTDWRVLHNSTDYNQTDTLVVELKDPLQNGTRNLTVTATYQGDDYDYYTFRAELGAPAGGTGRLLVQLESASSSYKGEVPEAVLSAPRFLGDSGTGTWTLAFANPPSVELFSNLTVEEITITQPEANGIFGPVTELSESTCAGSWTRVNSSVLTWTPSGTCTLHEHDVLNLTFEVESTGNGVSGAANSPFRPPAEYDNEHSEVLRDPIAQGFYQWKVPPDTVSYGGFPNDGAQDHALLSRTSYNTIPVEGDTTYGTAGLTLLKDALSLGRLQTTPGVAPVGTSVDVETNVASLLLILADKGFDPTIKTHIYGPWSMGERVPFHTVDHTEQDIEDKGNVVSMASHDMTGDGVPDILVATDESRIHALDGRNGVKLTGVQRNYVGDTITVFQKHVLSGTTRFVVGFEDRTSGDDLQVMDEDLNVLWSQNYVSDVVSVVTIADFSGDGKEDLAVGMSNGRAYVYDASDGTELYFLYGQDVPARLWHGATMGFDEEPLVLRSTGTTVDPGVESKDLDQSDNTMDQNGEAPDANDLAQALKSVHVSTASAGLEGYDAGENVEYQYLGAAYDVMDEGDLDGNGVTDLVGGRTSGYLSTLNGTQGNGEYALWQIASGNTIVDTETLGEYWMVTLSQDGVLMWTEDAWATRVYYGGAGGSPVLNFPYARGLDYVDKDTGWVVWGISGDTISVTTDGGDNFAELTYDLDDEDGDAMTPATDVAWRDIQWAGDDQIQGVLYGDDCRSISVDPLDLDAALTCPDGFIAYNGLLDPITQWHEATLPNATGRPVTDVHLVSGTTGVAVGEGGGVWTTTDLETWTWQGLNVSGILQDDDLRAVHMFNSSHGFAVGDGGAIFKTTDGAITWAQVESPTERNLQDITFEPGEPDRGWAVGNASTALRTFDGGEDWTTVNVPMAEDDAAGIDYYTVEVPRDKTGWISGGSTGTTATRLMGFFTDYVRQGSAQSTSLTDHGANGGIKNLTVYPEVRLATGATVNLDVSNDGCSSFQDADYTADTVNATLDLINGQQPVEVSFPDTTKDELCFRVNLSVTASESHYWSPWLYNLSIKYNYTTDASDPDPTWTTTWLNLTLDDPGQVDGTATTARWDTDAGRIGLPLFDNFWTHILGGSVNDVRVTDLDGDGDNEVLAATGDQWASADKLTPTAEDRRVYRFNGSTGALEATSAKLPGRVQALETVQLVNRTLDTVWDVLVISGDPDTGTYNLTALDGTDLSEIWTTSTSVPINDVITAHLDGDALPEAILGTAAQDGTWKAGSSEVRAHHADQDPAAVMWTAYPDLKGEYSFTYNVGRHLPFGPYVVETQVVWQGASGITQSARLYDYFLATPPGGEIPPSPLYNVELVVWFEDWG